MDPDQAFAAALEASFRSPETAKIGSVAKFQQNPLSGSGHGMRVMITVTGSFGEDAHHDREEE
jgi:hypothetical protein